MEQEETLTGVETILAAAREYAEIEEIEHESEGDERVHLAIVPKGKIIFDLAPYYEAARNAPRWRRGTATFQRADSLIAWVNRFKDADSALFVRPQGQGQELLAVLDYHRAGANGDPRFGKHTGVYRFPFSKEWLAWTGERELPQQAFAELLEDRITDVIDPSEAGENAVRFAQDLGMALAGPSTLLTLSRGLSVKVEAKVVNAQNLSTGEAQITFEESHRDEKGAPLKIPGGFVLAIPVFEGGGLYKVPARLRYRVRGGAITWRVLLHRADAVLQDAIDGVCEAAREATELPLFYGSPE